MKWSAHHVLVEVIEREGIPASVASTRQFAKPMLAEQLQHSADNLQDL
jgi:hypothetical protein